MKLVWGTVTGIVSERPGVQRLAVTPDGGEPGRAMAYTELGETCAPGDRVLLNTTAVDLSLGTGGWHFVVAKDPAGASGTVFDSPSGGHLMKLRYTPLQRDVMSVEAQESHHHTAMERADSLGGMPVVCCGLHSQAPLVAAGVKDIAPDARVAYVMTDAAALPLALSDLLAACKDAGLVDVSVTCGQAFGGDLEAVNLHSALLAARVVAGADVAVVAIGPGVVGSGTAFGHGGVGQGEAVNAAGVLGGRPVGCLRISFADTRERHRGVSHHSLTAFGRVALARATVAVPVLPPERMREVDAALEAAGLWARHTRVDAHGEPLPDLRGVEVRSMGRGPGDDPAFFAAAAAAGRVAGALL